MERPTCKSCPYWEFMDDRGNEVPFASREQIIEDSENDAEAECHRRSPLPILCHIHGDQKIHRDQYEVIWPLTYHWNSCGEHPAFPAYIASLTPEDNGIETGTPARNPAKTG